MKLSDKTKGVLLIVLVIIFIGVSMVPMVYWWNNPTLTKMEILKEFWELYLGLIVGMIGAQYLAYKFST